MSSHASDHLPIVLQVQSSRQQRHKREKGFKFEESWLLWNDCESVVQEAWGSTHRLASIKEKIKTCGAELMAWGSAKTDPDVATIEELQKRLDMLNEAETTEDSKAEYLEVSKRMDELLQKQEIYWAQRSRIPWLKHRDKNTKFFHSKATQQRRKNHIRGIQNVQGQWMEELEDIVKAASDYFDNLFCARAGDQMEECLNVVPSKVTNDMQEVPSSEFSAEEIKVALFQMGPIKAPGSNNMNALFYQKFWHVMGDNVLTAMLDFLNNGNMIPEINHTNIVLILKVKNPKKMSDFRPISLCNVIY